MESTGSNSTPPPSPLPSPLPSPPPSPKSPSPTPAIPLGFEYMEVIFLSNNKEGGPTPHAAIDFDEEVFDEEDMNAPGAPPEDSDDDMVAELVPPNEFTALREYFDAMSWSSGSSVNSSDLEMTDRDELDDEFFFGPLEPKDDDDDIPWYDLEERSNEKGSDEVFYTSSEEEEEEEDEIDAWHNQDPDASDASSSTKSSSPSSANDADESSDGDSDA